MAHRSTSCGPRGDAANQARRSYEERALTIGVASTCGTAAAIDGWGPRLSREGTGRSRYARRPLAPIGEPHLKGDLTVSKDAGDTRTAATDRSGMTPTLNAEPPVALNRKGGPSAGGRSTRASQGERYTFLGRPPMGCDPMSLAR